MIEGAEKTAVISNQWGLHARAAFALASLARRFASRIVVEKNGERADGKEVADLLSLCAAPGEAVRISAEGPDSAEAVEKLAALVESKFGEEK